MVTWLLSALWLIVAGLLLAPAFRHRFWLRLVVTGSSLLLVWALLVTGSDTPLRLGAALFALLLGPGLAWVPLLEVRDALSEGMLVLTFSLALSTAVSTLLVVTGTYTPALGYGLVAGVSLLGLVLQVAFRFRRSQRPDEVLSTP